MSKFDDHIQCEDSAEMVIYEEWMAYVEEINELDRVNWELLGVCGGCEE